MTTIKDNFLFDSIFCLMDIHTYHNYHIIIWSWFSYFFYHNTGNYIFNKKNITLNLINRSLQRKCSWLLVIVTNKSIKCLNRISWHNIGPFICHLKWRFYFPRCTFSIKSKTKCALVYSSGAIENYFKHGVHVAWWIWARGHIYIQWLHGIHVL